MDLHGFDDFGEFNIRFMDPKDLFKEFFEQGFFKGEDLSWLGGRSVFERPKANDASDKSGTPRNADASGNPGNAGPSGNFTQFNSRFGNDEFGFQSIFDRRDNDDFFTRGFGPDFGSRFGSGSATRIHSSFGPGFSSGGTGIQSGKSVSTVTKTVNGRSVTTTTTITTDANGNVTKEVKEETDDGRGNREVRYLTGGPSEAPRQQYLGNR